MSQDRQAHIDAALAAGTDPNTPFHLCGWVDDWPARQGMAASLPYPKFAQAAPNLMGADQDVMLYRAWKTVLGQYPSYIAQQIGDCFPAETVVRMAGGDYRPIAAVEVGDEVYTHLDRARRVTRTIRKPHKGAMIAFGVERAYPCVEATADHLFRTNGGLDWTKAADLREGMKVRFAHMGFPLGDFTVAGVQRYERECEVFCLEVEEDHSFLANGYASHNCTSFGSGHANDLGQAIEIAIGNQPIAYLETCTEAIYGMGREIAGMLGGGDGCYGVAVAKALTTMGAVPRKLVGPYSGQRAKQWGRSGVPAEIKKAAEPFKVGATSLVTTLEELDAALANLYPCAGGFSQGFSMHRDQDGVCRQQGRWGHEECCAGRRTRNGRRQYLLLQSWGDGVPDGPQTDDQPSWSFWIDETAMADILSQQDFLAFSKVPGFERREVPADFRYASAVG